MSFDQAIKHGKTRRKPYKGGKAVDSSCRNHGGCPICEGNRLHSDRMREEAAEEHLKQALEDGKD